MKREKLYFSNSINDAMSAYNKSYLIAEMKKRELSEIKVVKAIRELNTNYYFCKSFGEIGTKGEGYEPCGRKCKAYEPRNGKKGCCKHRGFCYEPSGKQFILKVNGKFLINKT